MMIPIIYSAKRLFLLLALPAVLAVAPVVADTQTPADTRGYGSGVLETPKLGDNVETQLDNDSHFTPWKQDDSGYLQTLKSEIEVQQVTKKHITTISEIQHARCMSEFMGIAPC